MTAWANFSEAVDDVSRGNSKLPQGAFLPEGPFPVVDQGQQLVAGYSDDANLLCKVPAPVIVFGDHTRALKYIDFPFIMGADGVKVLKVREGWDAKFVYHYLRFCNIPSAGYSRHFKFLKEVRIPTPLLDEQRHIAAILDQADALRAKRSQALTQLDTLTQAIFQDLFGDAIGNPLGYPVAILADWIAQDRPITYGILKPGPHTPGGVQYVRVADMKDRGIDAQGVRRTTQVIAAEYRRSQLRAGDLLMSIRGHVGRFAWVPDELEGANITQDSARLAVTTPDAAMYVRAAMESPALQHWMARRTKGAAVKGINLGDLRTLPLPSPPADHVKQFATVARRVEQQRDVMRSKSKPVDELFASLQSRAFRGEL